jgi:hypothetical protein
LLVAEGEVPSFPIAPSLGGAENRLPAINDGGCWLVTWLEAGVEKEDVDEKGLGNKAGGGGDGLKLELLYLTVKGFASGDLNVLSKSDWLALLMLNWLGRVPKSEQSLKLG